MDIFAMLQDAKCQICHDEINNLDEATYLEDMGIIHLGCYIMGTIEWEADEEDED